MSTTGKVLLGIAGVGAAWLLWRWFSGSGVPMVLTTGATSVPPPEGVSAAMAEQMREGEESGCPPGWILASSMFSAFVGRSCFDPKHPENTIKISGGSLVPPSAAPPALPSRGRVF